MTQGRIDLHRQMERINELEEVLSSFKHDARKLAVQLLVRRLHERYTRTQGTQSFAWWLTSCNRLERTFQYTGNGFGDQVRRRWALDDIKELQKAELQLLEDPEASWIPQSIARHINELYAHDKWLVHVEYEQLARVDFTKMPGGASLRFLRVLNPEWDSTRRQIVNV